MSLYRLEQLNKENRVREELLSSQLRKALESIHCEFDSQSSHELGAPEATSLKKRLDEIVNENRIKEGKLEKLRNSIAIARKGTGHSDSIVKSDHSSFKIVPSRYFSKMKLNSADQSEVAQSISTEKETFKNKLLQETQCQTQLKQMKAKIKKEINSKRKNIFSTEEFLRRISLNEKEGILLKKQAHNSLYSSMNSLFHEKIEHLKVSRIRDEKLTKKKNQYTQHSKEVNEQSNRLALVIVNENNLCNDKERMAESIRNLVHLYMQERQKRNSYETLVNYYSRQFSSLAGILSTSVLLANEETVEDSPDQIADALTRMLHSQSNLEIRYSQLGSQELSLKKKLTCLQAELETQRAINSAYMRHFNFKNKAVKVLSQGKLTSNGLVHELSIKSDNGDNLPEEIDKITLFSVNYMKQTLWNILNILQFIQTNGDNHCDEIEKILTNISDSAPERQLIGRKAGNTQKPPKVSGKMYKEIAKEIERSYALKQIVKESGILELVNDMKDSQCTTSQVNELLTDSYSVVMTQFADLMLPLKSLLESMSKYTESNQSREASSNTEILDLQVYLDHKKPNTLDSTRFRVTESKPGASTTERPGLQEIARRYLSPRRMGQVKTRQALSSSPKLPYIRSKNELLREIKEMEKSLKRLKQQHRISSIGVKLI